jgi:restriction endonuclease S subunit
MKMRNNMTWPTKKLGELISKYFSGTWGEDPKDDGNARIIRVSDIRPDLSINYENAPIRRLKEKDLEKYRLQIGDIVVVKSSGNQTKIISGRAALFEYKGKEVYVPSNFLIALRPNCNLIIPMWLWINLNSKATKRFIELIIGATTYPNLKTAEYLNLKIPVPPLPIQQKIVERLDAIKKAQELNDKQIELAEELFQSLLHRELDPKGKNWEVKKLGDVIDVIESGSRPKGGAVSFGIPSLGVEHINDNGPFNIDKIKYIPSDFFKNLKRGKIKKLDILIAKDGATTGKTVIVDNDFPFNEAAVNEHLFIIRGNPKIIFQRFLFYTLFESRGKKQILKTKHGAAQGGIDQSFVNFVKIPLPPLETQQKIVEKLSAVQEYKKKLVEQREKLKELFESVLHKSMAGKFN